MVLLYSCYQTVPVMVLLYSCYQTVPVMVLLYSCRADQHHHFGLKWHLRWN